MTKNKIQNIEGFHLLVAGISRHGKSYFVKKNLIPLLELFKPVIVFDRKHEYAGANVVDHDPRWIGCQGSTGFFERILEDDLKLKKQVYVIICQEDEDYTKGLRFLANKRFRQPVSVIVDEGHDIWLDPKLSDAKVPLTQVARYGAGYGMDTILITQRTKDVHPNIRSQFTSAVSFKQNHPADVKALYDRGWTGAEEVMNLNKREFRIFGDLPEHIESELLTKQ